MTGLHSPQDEGARRLTGALLEQPAFAARAPGLASALERFLTTVPRQIEALILGAKAGGGLEPVQATSLFRAIEDCVGLPAATYAVADPPARLLIALDERIDDLVVASVFGDSLPIADLGGVAPPPRVRTPIETALIEEFAGALGRALEIAFAPLTRLSIALEGLTLLKDVFALGRKDMPAAAARFSLPLAAGACEGLLLMPQTFLLPLRKMLEREPEPEGAVANSAWSLSMETGVKRTMLPVVAILEERSLTLADVAAFRVGAVLPLAGDELDSVRLECGGRGMFLCKLGQGDGRYRLEIEAALEFEPPAMG